MSNLTTSKSILILEDDENQGAVLELALKKNGYKHIRRTRRGVEAIEAFYYSEKSPDIALLDIELIGQAINGIEVGKKIMQLNDNAIIIYITIHRDEEIFKEALGTKPYAFIEKPYQIKRLSRNIEMAVNQVLLARKNISSQIIEKTTIPRTSKCKRITFYSDSLMIKKSKKCQEIIDLVDLLYVNSDGSFLEINLKDKKHRLSNYPIKTFDDDFTIEGKDYKDYTYLVRIHNSYIVNLPNVKYTSIENGGLKIHLKNDYAKLPVSRSYVDAFWKAWKRYLDDREKNNL